MLRRITLVLTALLLLVACSTKKATEEKTGLPLLKVTDNGRYLADENGKPRFL